MTTWEYSLSRRTIQQFPLMFNVVLNSTFSLELDLVVSAGSGKAFPMLSCLTPSLQQALSTLRVLSVLQEQVAVVFSQFLSKQKGRQACSYHFPIYLSISTQSTVLGGSWVMFETPSPAVIIKIVASVATKAEQIRMSFIIGDMILSFRMDLRIGDQKINIIIQFKRGFPSLLKSKDSQSALPRQKISSRVLEIQLNSTYCQLNIFVIIMKHETMQYVFNFCLSSFSPFRIIFYSMFQRISVTSMKQFSKGSSILSSYFMSLLQIHSDELIWNHLQYKMETPQKGGNNSTPTDTELTIDKALEFAGDNSSYQKKRLIMLSFIILSLAVLNCKIPFLQPLQALSFLLASGAGQIICPIYFDLATNSLGVAGFALLAIIGYPFSQFITGLAYCGLGFFGRGFFANSLIYLNQIGGDRFRAWSIIVIFAIWGLSSLLSSLEKMVRLPVWVWYYLLIFLPSLVGSYYVLKLWKPSPYSLYTKRMFSAAKQVLNEMAEQNSRAHLPYGLEGQKQSQDLYSYKRPTYFDIIHRPFLQKITVPLLVLWIYRQYVYFGSFLLMPQLSQQYSKNFILISISETVAVLMSYPIRLKVKRVNTVFSLTVLIAICSFASSFTRLSPECMEAGFVCPSKYIYRVSIMIIRFSIALMGNLLISYTMEVYPVNFRNMGFALCLGVSSIGSIFFPWINLTLIYLGMSGFSVFAVASVVVLYFAIQLNQTYGRMCNQNLEELQKASPLIQMKNWPIPSF